MKRTKMKNKQRKKCKEPINNVVNCEITAVQKPSKT